MLDAHILVPREECGDNHEYIDWKSAHLAGEIMEQCGLFPVHCLTIGDVRSAYDQRLTHDQCLEILFRIQNKDTSWDWDEAVRYYGSAMFPKNNLPGEDPDDARL